MDRTIPHDMCGNGHLRSDANTGRRPDGYRYCRPCQRDAARRHRTRSKEARELFAAIQDFIAANAASEGRIIPGSDLTQFLATNSGTTHNTDRNSP